MHKYYIRGLFIQIDAHEKKLQAEKVKHLLDRIRKVEQSNKSHPNDSVFAELCKLREELHSYLYNCFYFHIKRLHLNWYVYGNKPGALLAKQVSNPQDITDCFSECYSKSYYLSSSSTELTTKHYIIQRFGDSIHPPAITSKQLEDLNRPFSEK